MPRLIRCIVSIQCSTVSRTAFVQGTAIVAPNCFCKRRRSCSSNSGGMQRRLKLWRWINDERLVAMSDSYSQRRKLTDIGLAAVQAWLIAVINWRSGTYLGWHYTQNQISHREIGLLLLKLWLVCKKRQDARVLNRPRIFDATSCLQLFSSYSYFLLQITYDYFLTLKLPKSWFLTFMSYW